MYVASVRNSLFILLLSLSLPALASLQVGFSPEGSARELVLDVINHAQKSINLIGYSFQSPDIVQALIAAKNRGVIVRCVVDEKRNQNPTSQKAIAEARKSGIEVRLDSHYHIQHDKSMIIDDAIVETGSFNFAKSAEFENSENVLIIRDEPGIVKQYQQHWQIRWNYGK